MLRDLFSLFPAYAGVILKAEGPIDIEETFPRIRGGDPQKMNVRHRVMLFSPHTRG